MLRGIGSPQFAPFGDFSLEFPPVENKPADLGEVHLFTGVNGTGKTRILSLLAAVLGDASHLAKRLDGNNSELELHLTGTFPVPERRKHWSSTHFKGGEVHWSTESEITQSLKQLPAFAYSGTAYLSDAPVAAMADLERPTRKLCLSFSRAADNSKNLLQAITNLKIEAAIDATELHEGNLNQPSVRGNPRQIIDAIESTISQVTGIRFRFQIKRYPAVSLSVTWGEVKLAFNQLPDGLRSIIGWIVHGVVMMDVWLQRKSDPMQSKAIFLLDEIECHLHPAWQRKILPAFQRLFPNAQIFVATHSPFVIASLNCGWIHPLTLSPDGTVKLEQPISASKGDSYVTVLEEIMGIKEWYDPETESMLAKFRDARDAGFKGDTDSEAMARKLAADIGARSPELNFMMGREVLQMDRQRKPVETK